MQNFELYREKGNHNTFLSLINLDRVSQADDYTLHCHIREGTEKLSHYFYLLRMQQGFL